MTKDVKVEEIKTKKFDAAIIPAYVLDTICDNIERHLTIIYQTDDPEQKIVNIDRIHGWFDMVQRLNGNLPLAYERFGSIYARVKLMEESVVNSCNAKNNKH